MVARVDDWVNYTGITNLPKLRGTDGHITNTYQYASYFKGMNINKQQGKNPRSELETSFVQKKKEDDESVSTLSTKPTWFTARKSITDICYFVLSSLPEIDELMTIANRSVLEGPGHPSPVITL